MRSEFHDCMYVDIIASGNIMSVSIENGRYARFPQFSDAYFCPIAYVHSERILRADSPVSPVDASTSSSRYESISEPSYAAPYVLSFADAGELLCVLSGCIKRPLHPKVAGGCELVRPAHIIIGLCLQHSLSFCISIDLTQLHLITIRRYHVGQQKSCSRPRVGRCSSRPIRYSSQLDETVSLTLTIQSRCHRPDERPVPRRRRLPGHSHCCACARRQQYRVYFAMVSCQQLKVEQLSVLKLELTTLAGPEHIGYLMREPTSRESVTGMCRRTNTGWT